MIVAALVLSAQAVAILLQAEHARLSGAITNLAQFAASSFATLTCFRVSRFTRNGTHRMWRLASLSFSLWSVAQVIWTYNELRTGDMPVLSYGHILYFFSFAPLAAAVLADDARVEEGNDWLHSIDLLQAMIVFATAYFLLFGMPELWPNRQITAEMFYQAMNVRNVLLTVAFLLKAFSIAPSRRRVSLQFAGFLTLYTLCNLVSGYAIIYMHVPSGTTFDLAWTLPFLLISGIAIQFGSGSADEPAPVRGTFDLLKASLIPLALPLLVLAMAARIASMRIHAALVVLFASILCYGVRSFIIQARQARASLQLGQSENRFKLLFHKHPQPMWVFDPVTLKFLEVNQAAIDKYGFTREEFLAMTVLDIRPDEDVPQFMALNVTFNEPLRLRNWRHKVRSGKIMHVEVTAQKLRMGKRPAVLVIALDITDKMALEEQLRQSQKMEAVGTLAGGVAHDFNNLLTVIKGYSTLLLGSNHLDRDEQRQLHEIDRAAERAAGLTRQLLAFSRRQILRAEVIDVNGMVVNASRMLERLIGEDIKVTLRLAPNLQKVSADPAQVDQVLLNLAVNARDAMPQGGDLVFETRNIRASEIGDREHLHLIADEYVLLRVQDSGCGMSDETRAHIFEPFFTTKPVGKGTGLGLSTVYGIVKQSGGHIWVESAVDRGTAFSIYLPAIAHQISAASRADGKLPVAKETILLVEDEGSLRRYAARVLREQGYKVLEAGSGDDAARVAAAYELTIDVLLTDVVMPGINGRQLAERISSCRPEIKTLYMTGYTDEMVLLRGLDNKELEILQKPFPPDRLLHAVARTLERTQSNPIPETTS